MTLTETNPEGKRDSQDSTLLDFTSPEGPLDLVV